MAKFRSTRNSFLGGMISPTAVGRTDLPQYPHASELLQNVIPMTVGGAYRRPGTLLQDNLHATGELPPRLLPFIVSRTETYMLALGINNASNYVKSYRATGNSTGQVSTSTASGTHPYVAPTNADYLGLSGTGDNEYFNLQYTQSADVLYLAHPNHPPQVIKKTALDTFTIANFDAAAKAVYDASNSDFNGRIVAALYPFLNQNSSTATLKVSSNILSVTTHATDINLTAVWGNSSRQAFTSADIGSIWRIDGGSGVGVFVLNGITSTTVATGALIATMDDTSAHTAWWESAWGGSRGWPRSVCIFQQRLVYAGTTHQPDTLWFSQTANYEKFSHLNDTGNLLPPSTVLVNGAAISTTQAYINMRVDDSEGDGRATGPTGTQAFRITLSQNQLDQIQWLSPDKELLVGTLSQEWVISPQNGAFSIGESPTVLQSKYGSDYLMSSRIGYELIFPMGTQDELRAYQYNYIDASFFAEPVQLFFDQYPQPETDTIVPGRRKFRWFEWDVTRQTLWCLDTKGNFFGMTRDRKLSVTMWHVHQLGGFDTTKGVGTGSSIGDALYTDPGIYCCDGSVMSFAVVPNPFCGINDVWLCVKRTNGGSNAFHIERMIGKNTVRESSFSTIAPGGSTTTEPLLSDAASIFTDNGDGTKTYSVGTALNSYALTGTYYSKTYGLFKIATSAVSAGIATLTGSLPPDYGGLAPFHIITVGLPFTSIIKPVRIDAGSVIGTSQAAIKRINRCFVRFYKTLSAKMGSAPGGEDYSALETIVFSPDPTLLSNSPEVFTGDKKVIMPTTYDREGHLYLVQDQPLPFTVVSIVSEGEEFD